MACSEDSSVCRRFYVWTCARAFKNGLNSLGIDENAPSHGRGVLGDAMPSTIESAGWMSEFFTDQGTLGQLDEGGGVLFL
jgi:hypothetical protein